MTSPDPQLVDKPLLNGKKILCSRGSTRGREPLRVGSNACKKPASAGVCAAQRQLFGLRSRQKSEALGRRRKSLCRLF